MKNVVVIGCGKWGKNIIRCFYKTGSLFGIYDIDKNIYQKISEEYNGLKFYEKIDDILSDKNIDGVVIATPVETHYSLAKLFLENNKNVFLEKPMTIDVDSALDLVELSDKKKLVLLVGHVLEYHPAVVKMREIINDGGIGEIKEVHSNRLSPGRIRQFENVWWSFAPHDILLMIKTIKSDIIDVSCSCFDFFDRGIPDSTVTCFKFSNKSFAHIYVSWMYPFNHQSFVVVGTKGAVEFCDTRKTDKLVFYDNELFFSDNYLQINKGNSSVLSYEEKEPLYEECKDFLSSMELGKKPISSGVDGLRVVEILQKSVRSIKK